MNKIAQQTIDEVKNYQDIVAIINHYVPLTRRGRNYVGLCPFHSERSPSFTVSPEKKIFHCFGCHESGDIISFVSKIDNLTFSESIEQVAHLAGIEVHVEHLSGYDSKQDIDKKSLLACYSALTNAFSNALKKEPAVLSYLKERGISEESISMFSLGYSSPSLSVESLIKENNLDLSYVRRTGAFFETEQGTLLSRFNERLVFPIQNFQGKTIGFGGRTLKSEKGIAKYINSEESFIFNKRKILYGLEISKKSIKKMGYAILVEGYMDVIMLHQFGFTNAIASMGTALTMEQVLLLKRLTDTVYLAMDNDDAGQSAIEKSYEMLQNYEMKTKVVIMDEKDPADVLLDQGASTFQTLIANAKPMIEFVFQRQLLKHNTADINDVSRIINNLSELLKNEKDLVVKNHYIKNFSCKLGVDSDVFYAKMKNRYFNISKRLESKVGNKKSKVLKAEEFLIYAMASKIELREVIRSQLVESDLLNAEFRALFKIINNSTLEASSLITSIEDLKLRSLLSQSIVEMEQYGSDYNEQEVVDCVNTIKDKKLKDRVQEIKDSLKKLGSSGNDLEINALMLELQALKKGSNE